MGLYSIRTLVCGIVHIIDHIVHILWQDVMIFTNGGRFNLIARFAQQRHGRYEHTWRQVGMGNMGWHLGHQAVKFGVHCLQGFYFGWEDRGGFCNRQNLGICTNYHMESEGSSG